MSFTQFQTTDRVIDDRMNLFGNELISQITKYSTYDLYLKAGNLMNTQKPTGAGSLVTFANVSETEQLAFTFNYAIPEQLIISRDNRYNMVIPFEGLESNRSYIFRYVYTHEGTTIFDITRNAVTAATGKFTAEFQALNQNATDITAEANSTVTLRIYVKTVAGTDAQISLLVNDVNALGRLSRNEATAIISADNATQLIGFTRDLSVTGIQTISTLPNKKVKGITLEAFVNGTKRRCTGFYSNNGSPEQQSVQYYNDSTEVILNFNNSVILIAEAGTTLRTKGTIQNVSEGSFDINWEIVSGTGATGTVNVRMLVFYHGGD